MARAFSVAQRTYLTSSDLDLDLGQPTKERKPHKKGYISCNFGPDKRFLDTMVGVSQSNVKRLRREKEFMELVLSSKEGAGSSFAHEKHPDNRE